MIKFNVTKTQSFNLSLEDTVLEKTQCGEGEMTPCSSLLRVNIALVGVLKGKTIEELTLRKLLGDLVYYSEPSQTPITELFATVLQMFLCRLLL